MLPKNFETDHPILYVIVETASMAVVIPAIILLALPVKLLAYLAVKKDKERQKRTDI